MEAGKASKMGVPKKGLFLGANFPGCLFQGSVDKLSNPNGNGKIAI